ncbi:hypothetical protein [Chryseobacterium terrae]|uniref:RiboL-PSP-HEPN domain-containing protein n=1 Tax=Chryseobacterium terrae TaxID=3163299 RepID=A0ABW8Y290_9FLAO
MEIDESKYYNNEFAYRIQRNFQSKNKIKSVLNIYIITGIICFIFSGLYFSFSFFKYDLSSDQTIMLIFCGVSISISIISKMFLNLYKEKEKNRIYIQNKIIKIANFLNNWEDFERVLNRIIHNENLSENKFSYKENIDVLMHLNVISIKDSINLERALNIRNHVVHGESQFSYELVDKLSTEVEKITDKLIANYKYFR